MKQNAYAKKAGQKMKCLISLTGIEPVWFEMENSLPNCVKKA